MAVVARHGAVLMEETRLGGRFFYAAPGGAVEAGETPEEAVLRELKEECCLEGRVERLLSIVRRREDDRTREYAFEVSVPEDQEPVLGLDPELPPDGQIIRGVRWMRLDELSERDRAFLWQYGLMQVGGFREMVLGWSDDVSWPEGK